VAALDQDVAIDVGGFAVGQSGGEAGVGPTFRCLVGAGAGAVVGAAALVQNLAQSGHGAAGFAGEFRGGANPVHFVAAFGCFNMGGFMGMEGAELGPGYIPSLFVRTTRGQDGAALFGAVASGQETRNIAGGDVHSSIRGRKEIRQGFYRGVMMLANKPFPKPRTNPMRGKITWKGVLFDYELFLTHGMSVDSAEGRDIVDRITRRQRNGKPCFASSTPELVRKNLGGNISGYLFVSNPGDTDRASCSLQWQNYCGLPGASHKVWIFDLCRTYEGAKGSVSPTAVLMALVDQYAQAATGARDIYLMVSKVDPKEEQILLGVYRGYGFRQIPNGVCETTLQRDVMVRPVRRYGNNVFAEAYGQAAKRRTYKGGKARNPRRTYKRWRRDKVFAQPPVRPW